MSCGKACGNSSDPFRHSVDLFSPSPERSSLAIQSALRAELARLFCSTVSIEISLKTVGAFFRLILGGVAYRAAA